MEMLKFFKKNLLAVIACAYSLVVAVFWLALRVNWSGISKALGADKNPTFFVMQTHLLVCIFLWLAFVFSAVSLFVWKRKLPSIIFLCLRGVFTVLIVVVVSQGAAGFRRFFLPIFFE